MDDDKDFPTICGTGTEDYFCGSYNFENQQTRKYQVFSTPYAGLVQVLPEDKIYEVGQRFGLYRWHIQDPIRFGKDLKVTIQALGWNKDGTYLQEDDDIASVAFWYQKEPHAPFPKLPGKEGPPKVKGTIEGEEMKLIKAPGVAEPQIWESLSGDKQLWWHADMKVGDTLVLGFPAQKAGKYHVLGHFLTAPDYGIHQFAVNGVKAGDPIDFYQTEAKPTKELDLGVFELKEGENQFSATITGANPKAIKTYMLGLDYLSLKPAE
jgi:hypothetical protein